MDATRPTLDILLKVAPLVATHWYDVGLALGLNYETVENIDKQDTSECCKELFKLWLKTSDSASWNHLIKAVKSIKLDKIAENIEQKFLQWKYKCTTSGMTLTCGTYHK